MRQASLKYNNGLVRIRSPCPPRAVQKRNHEIEGKEARMNCSYIAVLLIGLLTASGAASQVVISEVMANPKGAESGAGSPGDRNEYVELYNRDTLEVDVNAWVLWDGDAYDLIEAWTDSGIVDPDVITDTTVIGPGCYAVILDPEYTSLGDTSYVQPYDFPPGTVVLTVRNTTLGDGLSSSDPISLGLPDTVFIDTYGTPSDTTDSIPFDAGDGVSIERIDLFAPDEEGNWAPCRDSMGTPGRKNSVTGTLEGGAIQSRKTGLRLQARPNPFSRDLTLLLLGEVAEIASIRIYDVAGRQVKEFDGEIVPNGVVWCGLGAAPGLYFCVAVTDRGLATVKAVKLMPTVP